MKVSDGQGLSAGIENSKVIKMNIQFHVREVIGKIRGLGQEENSRKSSESWRSIYASPNTF